MYYLILGGILVLSTLVLLLAAPRLSPRGSAGAGPAPRPPTRVAEAPAPRATVEQKLKDFLPRIRELLGFEPEPVPQPPPPPKH